MNKNKIENQRYNRVDGKPTKKNYDIINGCKVMHTITKPLYGEFHNYKGKQVKS